MAVTLAAVGDIHSPRYLDIFLRALGKVKLEPDAVLLAGDIIDKGKWRECTRVLHPLTKKWHAPLVAVFGNEEYDDVKGHIRSLCGQARWLDDEYLSLDIRGVEVGIIGTRGSLDRPTPWQSKHMPGIESVYRERVAKIRRLLLDSRRRDDITVLLTHYPPRADTLRGEDERFWPQMSSRRMAEAVVEARIDAVIHGHLHRSTVVDASLDGVKVYNVALPATREIRVIRLEEKRGILGYF